MHCEGSIVGTIFRGGFKGFGLLLIQRRHVVAEGVELHGHAGEVELVEGADVAAQSGFGAGLHMLVAEEVVDSRGAFGYEFRDLFGGFVAVAQKVSFRCCSQ